MSQDNTPPRDGSPRDKDDDKTPPAPESPPLAAGEQPPAAPWAPPSGLQPDPAPELDPDFVPDPAAQPDPALPPTEAQAPSYPSAYPGQEGQPPYPGQPPFPGQELPPEAQGDPVNRQRLVIGGIVVGVLVLIGVVIWVLLNLLGARPEATVTTPSATATPGPLPRDANSKDFQVGDCFADFDPNASEARAVACDTEHSAQLIGVHVYPGDDSFPGTNALRDKGREVCKASVANLNAAADNYVLLQQNVYPSTTSWDRGDRRVDCFIVVDSGNSIKEDLLQK
ncbi:septum formation family protein [Arthrobacter sp. AK01]|uniref:septum formation family protein n=1 Tax=Arthrobacter sp. AK01 TaxID=2894084 RepID=UPI001E4B2CC6|nr:septum formation family protein [Arthrobacter sp. AK01]MCD4849364.1 septum formation family protein [Arthrobacter sp. AK01]